MAALLPWAASTCLDAGLSLRQRRTKPSSVQEQNLFLPLQGPGPWLLSSPGSHMPWGGGEPEGMVRTKARGSQGLSFPNTPEMWQTGRVPMGCSVTRALSA